MLVAVTGGNDQVKLLTKVEIVNSAGKVLFDLTLTRLTRSNDDFMFTSDPFMPPNDLFYIVVS